MTKGILITSILLLAIFSLSPSKEHLVLKNPAFAKQNDSTLLAALMDSFLIAQYKDYFENYEQLPQEYMDSLFYYENRLTWHGISASYTPDSLYKVVVYEGEGCGAYCNPIYESEILTRDNLRLGPLPGYIYPIDTIHMLPNFSNAYLLIQNIAVRPAGFHSAIGKKASIIDMSGSSPKQICFPDTIPESGDCDLRIEVPHFADLEAIMRFNDSTSTLHFEYLNVDVYAEDMTATDSLVYGEVIFLKNEKMEFQRASQDYSDSTVYGY